MTDETESQKSTSGAGADPGSGGSPVGRAPRDRNRRGQDRPGGEGRPGRDGAPGAGEAARGTPLTQQVGRITLIVLATLFGVFAVVNSQFVDFNWIFGSTSVTTQGGERVSGGVPLIVLLVGSFLLGGVGGWFLGWRRRRGRPARARADRSGTGPEPQPDGPGRAPSSGEEGRTDGRHRGG